jgi:glycosyltransferase involved in cell wall biosynthesis
MKLAMVYPHLFGPGGIPYKARSLLTSMARNGCEILSVSQDTRIEEIVASPKHLAFVTEAARHADWRSWRYPQTSLPVLSAISEVRKFGAEAVIAVGARSPDLARFLAGAKLSGIRYIIFAHGLYSRDLILHRWSGKAKGSVRKIAEISYLHLVDRPCLRQALAARALSQTEAQRLRSLGARNVFVVPDGFDSDWIPTRTTPRSRANGGLNLLYLGRPAEYQKGLDLLVKAVLKLPSNAPIVVRLVGPGCPDYKATLERRLGSTLPPSLQFHEAVLGDEKETIFERTDFFVNVSRWDGMAKAPCEALCRGIPLIATLESNLGDWVLRQNMGFVTKSDALDLTHTLLVALSQSSATYTIMSENAVRFATSNTWDSVARSVEDQISSVLQKRGFQA